MWKTFNFVTTLFSIGLAFGTYFVITHVDLDCGGIKTALWLVMLLHIMNALETVINICGLERFVC